VEAGLDLFYVFDSLHVPVAEFSADLVQGCEPLTVHFTDESQQAQAWQWQMPGSVEGSSTDQNPTATYLSDGTYNVTLKVTNGAGQDSITKTTYITVLASPSPVMSSTPDNGSANGTATATPSGGVAPYVYNWSDGQTTQTATGLTPGWYSVTVTDDNDCESVDSVEVVFNNGVTNPSGWNWQVHPNPTSGEFHVTIKGSAKGVRAALFSASGQLLQEWETVENSLTISPPAGSNVLILQLTDALGRVVRTKLIRLD
jgi:hypothetical protein